jgi:dienelactone hydrolase
MMGKRVSYLEERQPLEGYLAAPESARNLPGVLVVPSWLNVNESICRRADRLAELGYAAFVADLFGAGVRPSPPQPTDDSCRAIHRRSVAISPQAFGRSKSPSRAA